MYVVKLNLNNIVKLGIIIVFTLYMNAHLRKGVSYVKVLTHRLLTLLNHEYVGSTNENIANTMIENLNDLDKYSIDELSCMCNVSKSTLSKFVRNIGFDDFKDFRLTIFEEKEAPNYKYRTAKTIGNYIEEFGIEKYIKVLNEDISLLLETVNHQRIKELAELIYYTPKVAAFGTLYSETVALDFQYMMAFNKKLIFTTLDDIKQDAYIEQADSSTLIIIFSNSGNYLEEYQLVTGFPKKDTFDKTKAKVALITSNDGYQDDERVDVVVNLKFSTNLQNHPYILRIINEMILAEYKKLLS